MHPTVTVAITKTATARFVSGNVGVGESSGVPVGSIGDVGVGVDDEGCGVVGEFSVDAP